MYRTCLLLAALLPLPLQAEDGVGRLFYTPQERQQLNAMRNRNAGVFSDNETLTVNGVVVRSSGKSTVWLNGTPTHDGAPHRDATVLGHRGAGGRITLHHPPTSKTFEIRAGQTVDLTAGRVREPYVRPSSPSREPGP